MYLIRLGGILVSLGITGYLIWAMLSSNSKVDKAIDANPTVVEQKKALKDAGINADDKKALNKALSDSVNQLRDYQKQADGLSQDPP
jgi:hypothetical protein